MKATIVYDCKQIYFKTNEMNEYGAQLTTN